MGFWPFGGGKKSRAQTGEEETKSNKLQKATSRPTSFVPEKTQAQIPAAGRNNGRREFSEKLPPSTVPRQQPHQRNSSAPLQDTRHTSQPTAPSQSTTNQLRTESSMYLQSPTSQSSIGPDVFTATPNPPTLRATRDDYDPTIPRRKSSKRKAEDHAREQKVRALASSPIPVPKRPLTYSGTGPLRRESRHVPGDLNRRLNRPTSEISLPYPDSLSEMDDMAAQSSFKIGILAALSPRPTIRYDINPRSNAGKQPSRQPLAVKQPIEEEGWSQNRIEELADDLDAKGLRELMERDRRRKERKKEADKAKLQRKLQRRADRQQEDEQRHRAEPHADGSSSPRGRESPSEGPSRRQYPDSKRYSNTTYETSLKQSTDSPFADPASSKRASVQPIRNPFEDEKDLDLMDDPFDHDDDGGDRPPLPVKSPLRTVETHPSITDLLPSSAAISPPTSPIQQPADRPSFSQSSIQPRDATPEFIEASEFDRRASDTSSQRLNNWTNFFRRGGRPKPDPSDRGGRTTPSEFSNTSRESFARKQQPPPAAAVRTFRYSASATPQRTLSKFREDLPELPISPPYSRVQSPEVAGATRVTSVSPANRSNRGSLTGTLESRSLMTSSSIPTLEKSRVDSKMQARESTELDSIPTAPVGVILSQSLASVDSEGSWLSGKPMKRISGPLIPPLRQSPSSLQAQIPGGFPTEEEGLGDDANSAERNVTSEEEMIPAFVATSQSPRKGKKNPSPDIDEDSDSSDQESHGDFEDEDKHGLLSGTDPTDAGVQEVSIHRAKSVDYKGHARHISAGSARILDIRRSSTMLDSAPLTPTMTSNPSADASQMPSERS